jgi:serine phosphatase RsbU (regulator of sigma subunit)
LADTEEDEMRLDVTHRRALAKQRAVTQSLQRLLAPPPTALPEGCGLRISARCHSADAGLRVGGDWHLARALPTGDVVFAVGDVAGHGLSAAAAMLELRYATAAYMAELIDPAVVLGRLTAFLTVHRPGVFATAVIARYSPTDGRLIWARAGHPPLLLAHGNVVTALPNPAGQLLGLAATSPYEQASIWLRRGERVVGYTDGMIGRGHLDAGIAALAEQIRRAPREPMALFDQLDYDSAGDDACILIAERVR